MAAFSKLHPDGGRTAADRRPAAADRADRAALAGRGPRRRCSSGCTGCCAATARRSGHDRRVLLEEFELTDIAGKVVGVGSVGTRAWIALLLGRDGQDPLFLQIKQAEASVLEAAARPERVHKPWRASGRRAAADAGHERHLPRLAECRRRATAGATATTTTPAQLKDWKGSAEIEQMGPAATRRLRHALRLDAGPCARPQRRPHRDRRLSAATATATTAQWSSSPCLRRTERARLPGAAGRRRLRQDRRTDRALTSRERGTTRST